MTTTLTAPTTLNGLAVIASAPRKNMPDRLAVLVHRPDSHQPYVVAQWNEHCGDSWHMGEYYGDLMDAVAHFAWMTGQTAQLIQAAKA